MVQLELHKLRENLRGGTVSQFTPKIAIKTILTNTLKTISGILKKKVKIAERIMIGYIGLILAAIPSILPPKEVKITIPVYLYWSSVNFSVNICIAFPNKAFESMPKYNNLSESPNK